MKYFLGLVLLLPAIIYVDSLVSKDNVDTICLSIISITLYNWVFGGQFSLPRH